MKPPVLPPGVLDGLRCVGDPKVTSRALSARTAKRYQPGYPGSGAPPREAVNAAKSDANSYLAHVQRTYGAHPGRMIARARGLFVRYGDEISAALLLCGLPESYAAEWGAPVLIAHGDLVWQLPRRIRQTALFLLGVMTDTEPYVITQDPRPSAGAPALGLSEEQPARVVDTASTFFQQCVWLRHFHAGIRESLLGDADARREIGARNAPPCVPLNQEDLLATLLTFSVTTFRVLKAFGIAVDDEDREAYVFLWNLVGACLGVGTPTVGDELRKLAKDAGEAELKDLVPDRWLLPETVPKAYELLDQLQARQWIAVQTTLNAGRPFPWTDLVPGRTLVSALLGGLADAMPPSRKAWPAIVMRELVPDRVQWRLGLQRTGMVGLAGSALKATRGGTRIRSSALRLMANDVTRQAMQKFLQADGPSPFRIPGLDLTQLSPARRGSPYELKRR